MRKTILLLAATALAGCVSLDPSYDRPDAPVPEAASYGLEGPTVTDAGLGWREVFQEPELAALIEAALENNRTLRQAALDVERARALYRIQRADSLPNIAASGAYSRDHYGSNASAGAFGTPVVTGDGETDGGGEATGGQSFTIERYSATAGISAFELDLFGRLRSLNRQALEAYFATDAARRSTEVALVSAVAESYLQLAADRELLAIARSTVDNQAEALDLTTRRFEGGVGTEVDRQRVLLSIERARIDAAALAAQVRIDENALRLLVGLPQLPTVDDSATIGDVALRRELPAAVPSSVLLGRPDVLAAEHRLLASNADIGAARASFFPRLSLTATGGTSSTELDALFGSGTGFWSFSPQVTLPIFAGGGLRGNLGRAKAERAQAQAAYEYAIQTAFREVADALATRATIADRIEATDRLADAAALTLNLAERRYEAGVEDYLSVLDAQREDYTARRERVAARLIEAGNVVALYRALGGLAPEEEMRLAER
ncbi:efflux transporter outer membrane subunit [Parvularcula dongshanensis]|uniref:Multidrug efflux system outer membrane protein n=1 Tax=Parvularcula dongshanensis TaxID=1173995 RepID=A0A840I558_9PROT|nr:efflux transporter outer membrane subunit [Parvularcula dongshanensis]MBB4659512.1 multidrug efflux system outer membrane protein [Parvularcula dongshanensis]